MGPSDCINRSQPKKSLKWAWYTECVLSREGGSVPLRVMVEAMTSCCCAAWVSFLGGSYKILHRIIYVRFIIYALYR